MNIHKKFSSQKGSQNSLFDCKKKYVAFLVRDTTAYLLDISRQKQRFLSTVVPHFRATGHVQAQTVTHHNTFVLPGFFVTNRRGHSDLNCIESRSLLKSKNVYQILNVFPKVRFRQSSTTHRF